MKIKNTNFQSYSTNSHMEADEASLQYGFDWRFLPDLPSDGKLLIIVDSSESHASPSDSLIPQTRPNGDSKKYAKNPYCHWQGCTLYQHAEFLQNSTSQEQFDIVAIPHGISDDREKKGRLTRTRAKHSAFINPELIGFLCMGFANSLNMHRLWRKSTQKEVSFPPWTISRVLKNSGYKSVSLYGAIPDHKISRYIFPLQINTVRFVVLQHYGTKAPVLLSPFIPSYFIAFMYRYLLPSYWIVASKT